MTVSFQCPCCATAYHLDDSRAGTPLTCRQCGQEIQAPGSPPLPPGKLAPAPPDERNNMTLLSPAPTRFLSQITHHIDRTIGYSPMVFHEIVSDDIHLDLHVVPPHPGPPSADHPFGRGFYTIVTSGMSTRAMPPAPALPAAPGDEAQRPRFAELMITLPADWPGLHPDGTFIQEYMSDEANWWPVRWLKMLARLPHEQDTWVGAGYSVSNGPERQGLAHNTGFTGMLLLPSRVHPDARCLVVHDDLAIQFLALWPLYPEEMDLKLNRGLDALQSAFARAGVTDLVNIHRPNVARAS
jgi:hypothetical protein